MSESSDWTKPTVDEKQTSGRHRLPQTIPLRKPSSTVPRVGKIDAKHDDPKVNAPSSLGDTGQNGGADTADSVERSLFDASVAGPVVQLIDLRKTDQDNSAPVIDLSTSHIPKAVELNSSSSNLQSQIDNFVQHLHSVRPVPQKKRVSQLVPIKSKVPKLGDDNKSSIECSKTIGIAEAEKVPDKRLSTSHNSELNSPRINVSLKAKLESAKPDKDKLEDPTKLKLEPTIDHDAIKHKNSTEKTKNVYEIKTTGGTFGAEKVKINKNQMFESVVQPVPVKRNSTPSDFDSPDVKKINKSISIKSNASLQNGKNLCISCQQETHATSQYCDNCENTKNSGDGQVLRRKRKSSIYVRETNDKELKVKKIVQKFAWDKYLAEEKATAAPAQLFEASGVLKNNFQTGMQLEGIDPRNPVHYCVLSVADVVGLRLRLHFDGYSDSYDFWTYCDSPFIFPVGWCSEQAKRLMPHPDYNVDEFDWHSYMKSKGTVAAKRSLFARISNPNATGNNPFRIGDKLEAVDRQQSSSELVVCVATVADVLWDKYVLVHFDSWDSVYDYWCRVDDPSLRPVGWCRENKMPISPPDDWTDEATFCWEDYLASTNSQPAPREAFNPRECLKFEVGMKLEAVDKRNPPLVRVATIVDFERSKLNSQNLFVRHSTDGHTKIVNSDDKDDDQIGAAENVLLSSDGAAGSWKEDAGDVATGDVDDVAVAEDNKTLGKGIDDSVDASGGGSGTVSDGDASERVDSERPSSIPQRLSNTKTFATDAVRKSMFGVNRVKVHYDGWSDIYDVWMEDDSPDLHPAGWCHKTGHHLTPPISPNDFVNPLSTCPTLGCNGTGHIKGPKYSAHHSAFGCPYSSNNLDFVLADRLSKNLDGEVRVSKKNNSFEIKKCPTPGCDGSGHITGKFSAHYRQSGCPNFDNANNANNHNNNHHKSATQQPQPAASSFGDVRKETTEAEVKQEPEVRERGGNGGGAAEGGGAELKIKFARPNIEKTLMSIGHVQGRGRPSKKFKRMMEMQKEVERLRLKNDAQKENNNHDDALVENIHKSIFSPASAEILDHPAHPKSTLENRAINNNSKTTSNNICNDANVTSNAVGFKNFKNFARLLPCVKSSYTEKLVTGWNIDQIATFVASVPGCATLSKNFVEQQIDGESFVMLTQSDLIEVLNLKLGPAIKILNCIYLIRNN